MPVKQQVSAKPRKSSRKADKARADEDAGGDLKSMINASRNTPLQIAFCIGSKPEESVIVMHRKKSADVLLKDARKQGKSAKLGCGTVETSGKAFKISLTDAPPSGTARALKACIKAATGLSLQVSLQDQSGCVLDSEGEGDQAGPSAQAARGRPDQSEVGIKPERLSTVQNQLKALFPRLKEAGAQDREFKKVARLLVPMIVNADHEGDQGAANQRLENLVDRLIEAERNLEGGENSPRPGDETDTPSTHLPKPSASEPHPKLSRIRSALKNLMRRLKTASEQNLEFRKAAQILVPVILKNDEDGKADIADERLNSLLKRLVDVEQQSKADRKAAETIETPKVEPVKPQPSVTSALAQLQNAANQVNGLPNKLKKAAMSFLAAFKKKNAVATKLMQQIETGLPADQEQAARDKLGELAKALEKNIAELKINIRREQV